MTTRAFRDSTSSFGLRRAGAALALVTAFTLVPARADDIPGVTGDRVLFGQSAAFCGPAEALGRGMRLGIRTAFEERNRDGGVHVRRLELVSLDD